MSTPQGTVLDKVRFEIADQNSDQIGLAVLMIFLLLLGILFIVFIWVKQFGYASQTTKIWVTVGGSLLILTVLALGVAYYRNRNSLLRMKEIEAKLVADGATATAASDE